jgi:hypothetical protein
MNNLLIAKHWIMNLEHIPLYEITEYGENKVTVLIFPETDFIGQIDIFSKANFDVENDFIEVIIISKSSEEIMLNLIEDFDIEVLEKFTNNIINYGT